MSEISSMIFMGCCLFIPIIASAFCNRKQEVIKYVEKPVFIEKKIYIEKQPSVNSNPLIGEAMECLIALGMKKTEAKKKVEEMFKVKNFSSIEGFLLDVYKK